MRGSKEKRRGGLREWLTGSFRLDGRSILRGREEVHLCHCDVWLLCDCSADYVQGRGKKKRKVLSVSVCVCVLETIMSPSSSDLKHISCFVFDILSLQRRK